MSVLPRLAHMLNPSTVTPEAGRGRDAANSEDAVLAEQPRSGSTGRRNWKGKKHRERRKMAAMADRRSFKVQERLRMLLELGGGGSTHVARPANRLWLLFLFLSDRLGKLSEVEKVKGFHAGKSVCTSHGLNGPTLADGPDDP